MISTTVRRPGGRGLFFALFDRPGRAGRAGRGQDVRIFVDCDEDTRFMRRLARSEGGEGRGENALMWWARRGVGGRAACVGRRWRARSAAASVWGGIRV